MAVCTPSLCRTPFLRRHRGTTNRGMRAERYLTYVLVTHCGLEMDRTQWVELVHVVVIQRLLEDG
jgi:hypothetical protein